MRIDWLESAFLDLHRVRETIRQFDPVAAQRTVACIEAAARNLARFPGMGRPGEVAQTRELMIPGLPFLIIYRVNDDRVQILRVLLGKQNGRRPTDGNSGRAPIARRIILTERIRPSRRPAAMA